MHVEIEKDPMATGALITQPRPDLDAHRESISASFPHIVGELVAIIGRKLAAYVASIKDARAIDRWLENTSPQRDIEQRIRLTYHVAALLAKFDRPATVQAWLIGVNPELNDRVPISLLREGDIDVVGKEVLSAARAFVAGG